MSTLIAFTLIDAPLPTAERLIKAYGGNYGSTVTLRETGQSDSESDSESDTSESDSDNEREDLSAPLSNSRNWNEELQQIIEAPSFLVDPSEEELTVDYFKNQLETLAEFRRLSGEFKDEAIRIAKVIIDEIAMPLSEKTYKPRNVGGIAGKSLRASL